MAKLGEVSSRILTIEYPDKINVRIDVNIVREELRADPRFKTVYERLADVVRESIDPGCPRPTKEYILSFIDRFQLNPTIKDLDIRKHQFALEPDSIVIYNAEKNETLLNIKVLKTVLTADIIKAYHSVRAGTNAVTMSGKPEEAVMDGAPT